MWYTSRLKGQPSGCSGASEMLSSPEPFYWCAGQSSPPWKPLNTGHPFLQYIRECGPPWILQAAALGFPQRHSRPVVPGKLSQKFRGRDATGLRSLPGQAARGRRAEQNPLGQRRKSRGLGSQWDGQWRFYPHAESTGLSDSTSARGAGQGIARVWWGGARAGSGQG